MFTVLHVGSEGSATSAIARVVERKRNCKLEFMADFLEGAKRGTEVDNCLAILQMPAGDEMEIVEKGAEFLIGVRTMGRHVPTIVLMHDPNVDLTLCFLQLGAVECLCDPLSISRLSLLIDIITASSLRRNKLAAPETESEADNFLCHSPTMSNLLDAVRLVARLETTILLSGETGTGKSSLARMIHACSPHMHSPFMTVNCGTLAPTLIESELFGHKRGAFTGADDDHIGKFALAERGTLLLDDVDTLPLEVQTKFLRVIEERKFEAVGSEQTSTLDARVIAATNKDLEAEVAQGRFRSDLFYRLNVAAFRLPPLRERDGEIQHLVDHFRSSLAAEHGLGAPRFSPLAAKALQCYNWPGNIRELRNAVEHCLIMSSGEEIDLQHLPERVRRAAPWDAAEDSAETPDMVCSLKQVKRSAEHDHLVAALQRNDNNKSRTAEELGISRAALYKQLRKHKLK